MAHSFLTKNPAWSWCPWQPRSCCWGCCRGSHRLGRWRRGLLRSWSRTGRGPRSSYGPSSCQFPGIIRLLRCVLFILNNTNLQCNVFICLCFEKWVEVDIAINSDGTIGYQQGLIYQPYFCKLYKILPLWFYMVNIVTLSTVHNGCLLAQFSQQMKHS